MDSIGRLVSRQGEELYRTTDLDEFQAGLTFTRQPRVSGMEKGRTPEIISEHLSIGCLSLYRLRSDAPFRIDTNGMETDTLVISLAAAGACESVVGARSLALARNIGTIVGGNEPAKFTLSSDFDCVTLVVPRHRLEVEAGALLGREAPTPLSFTPVLRGEQLENWARCLAAGVSMAKEAAEYPLVRANIEQMIVSALLLKQPNNYSEALAGQSSLAPPVAVRRAMEYMEAHLARPLAMAEIAAQAGTSIRNLQKGFHTYCGESPGTWLRHLRLDRAHITLREAEPDRTTVTNVCFAFGFPSPSEFAARYRARFGCTPSETLRKRV